MFATMFAYVWDLRVDWGLTRSWKQKTFGLRKQITFSALFYYWAIGSNFCLRFFWVIFVAKSFVVLDQSGTLDVWKTFSLQLGVSLIAELLRRT